MSTAKYRWLGPPRIRCEVRGKFGGGSYDRWGRGSTTQGGLGVQFRGCTSARMVDLGYSQIYPRKALQWPTE